MGWTLARSLDKVIEMKFMNNYWYQLSQPAWLPGTVYGTALL